MASYADLLDVQFQDVTSHAATSQGDILGVVMPYFWGVTGKRRVYDRADFYQMYPESLPAGVNIGDFPNDYFDAYAQVKKYFDNGGKRVEVFVPDTDMHRIAVPDPGATITGTDPSRHASGENWNVVFRYQGLPPAVLLPSNATHIGIIVAADTVTLKAGVPAGENPDATDITNWQVVEQWHGQFTDVNALEDGQYTHFSKVLESSNLLRCIQANDPAYEAMSYTWNLIDGEEANETKVVAMPLQGNLANYCNVKSKFIDATGAMFTEDAFKSFYTNQFNDLDTTKCTQLLIAPSGHDAFITEGMNIVETRKNCVLYSSAWGADGPQSDFTLTAKYNTTSTGAVVDMRLKNQSKFHLAIAGYERLTLFGANYYLDCVGGVAGAHANIAQQVRLNQLASARTYGQYNGTLVFTPSFATVLDLHSAGVITVYTASTGSQIFGVHNTLYPNNPNSYFATANVSRVLAALLYDIQPLLLDAIHTDAAANPVSRASLSTRCNNIVNDHIGRQNLQSDSEMLMTDQMNTDALTLGGRKLNCILKCHFIGLVETISLKVVATDSSVSTEII